MVKAGDPLFEILPDPTPLELTEARREVEIARNVFDQAKKRHDRTRGAQQAGNHLQPGLGSVGQGDPGRARSA